ncbi:MAG: hypothetical protein U9O89_06650 [Thermoproteota archaeon]|nr:hypothetical protein [Thermoproteota archaeon]
MDEDLEIGNDLRLWVGNCIKKLLTKFMENPFFFYTESDMHCYLYHLLLQEEELLTEYPTKDEIPTILLHREYPTLGKYTKEDDLLKPSQMDGLRFS